ncbi:MAG: bifunctional DNA primase/polymerase, partial [Planctomycetaceae bacterium]|nr:bifunctional DNA primase/polymerase [Planctomycetaceae bacterium]
MSILSEALRYRRLGLSVIPIRAGTKMPAVKAWKPYTLVAATEADVRRWFDAENHTALAIICGPVSGDLFCRDFDTMESYHAWANAHSEWASRLPTVATHRGRHVYCRGDVEVVRTVAKGGGLCAKLVKGELRAGGCYVVAPPSRHLKGSTYRWLIPIDGDIPRVDLRAAGLIPCNGEDRAGGVGREHGATGDGIEP